MKKKIYTDEELKQRQKESQHRSYYKNLEKRKEYNKKYYETHRDQIIAGMKKYTKIWREKNRDRWNEYTKMRNKAIRIDYKMLKAENEKLKQEVATYRKLDKMLAYH